MLELLILNLTYVAYGMALLAVFWCANFAFSLYYNIAQLHETFDWKRMLDGLYKIIVVIIGTALLAIGITFIPHFLALVGLTVSTEVLEAFNILVVIGIYFEATYSYFSQAKETLTSIMKFYQAKKEIEAIVNDTNEK